MTTPIRIGIPFGKADSTLKPAESTTAEGLTKYTIGVKTSNRFGAGTDANIFCQIFGEFGKSPVYKLENSITHKNKFERNSLDVFEFDNQPPIGELWEVSCLKNVAAQVKLPYTVLTV